MAILEINLEKPALIEEYQYPEESTKSVSRTGRRSSSKSSGGSKGKLVGLLVLLVGVGVAVWKLRSRGRLEQTDFDEFGEDSEYEGELEEGEEYEHGPEPEIGADESRGSMGKVAGLLGFAVALVTVVAAVRKARN